MRYRSLLVCSVALLGLAACGGDSTRSDEASATDYESRALSRAGSPASVFAPNRPGAYELRYVWAEEDSVLTTRPLTVTRK